MSGEKRRRLKDEGAALIAVLSMLAIMSTLAIVVMDSANMAVRRTANVVQLEQTRWYLMGAEAFAAGQIAELHRRSEDGTVDVEDWIGRTFTFPLDDGAMSVSLRDGDNCFNLNSLVVASDEGRYSISGIGLAQFSRLLDIVGVHAAGGALAPALIDWLDTDGDTTPGGAEDAALAGGTTYRTADTLLSDVGELRGVRGFDSDTLAKIAPYVCVRPTPARNAINPNTLTPDQAPLLAMLVADLSISSAAQIIRDRPRGGWRDLDSFLLHPSLSGLEISDAARAQFSLQTRYYVLHARVERDRGREASAALIEATRGGDAYVVRRVFGVGAAGRLL